ncbi:MAG: histidine phosphatase family protein [Sphingomonadales bacterium]|nr:histidine phosphatase family protein [Sphingomonadales bacterium]
MKILGLFRHAKSDWGDPRARDFDRPLNARGRKGAALMGQHISAYCRDRKLRWDRIIASPAARSAETIEIGAGASPEGNRVSYAVNWDRRIYLASSATLIDVLREQDDAVDAVLMVGHNPGLEDVIFDLVPDDGSSPLRDEVEVKFPTAAFALLELDIDHWRALEDGCARLVHLMRPRDIDPALGPEPV